MYRFSLVSVLLALVLASTSTAASDVDKYATAFGWPERWERVITRQTETYIDRMLSESGDLSAAQKEEVGKRIRNGMSQWLSWQRNGKQFTQSFIDSCGTDLLDQVVEINSGVNYTASEKQAINSDYATCAKEALERVMQNIIPSFEQLNRAGSPEERFDQMVSASIIISKKAQTSFTDKYLNAKGHKAFAQSESGNWNWRSNRTSIDHAINNALASCRARNLAFEVDQPCRIIHVNDEWTDVYRQSITHRRRDESLIMSNKALDSYREKFVGTTKHKAFAQSDNGSWSWRSSTRSRDDAIAKALTACRKNNKKHETAFPCRIVNLNDNWLVE